MIKLRNRIILIINNLARLFTELNCLTVNKPLALKLALTHLRWATCEGGPGIKRAKAFHLALVRALMGVDFELPLSSKYKRLWKQVLIRSKRSNLDAVFWITVSNLHRLLKCKPDFDTTTITSSFSGSIFKVLYHLKDLRDACNQLRTVGCITDVWCAKWKWHISGKSGPNGGPAYTKFLEDLCANSKNGLYYKNLLLLYTLPLQNKEEAHDTISRAYQEGVERHSNDRRGPIHSRLSFLSDKAGKTRVVAIIDILSQSVLAIVHKRLFGILRKLETDGTFDQDKQRRRVKRWSEENEFTASIDLSAATDRLPVLYQAFVLYLCRALTWKQAIAWLVVITWRPFTVKGDKEITYTVGQPMGALSSWPAMALSHHALVLWSSKIAYPDSKEIFSNYALLGDDLVIRDKYVSEAYLRLISALGVEYAPNKSFLAVGRSEFAKSLYRSGEELTPFPASELLFTNKTVCNNTLSILSWFKERNLKLTLSSLTGLFPAGKWRKLAELTSLSPVAPSNLLDVRPVDDFSVFYSLLWKKRVDYFSRAKTLQKTVYDFYQKNPVIGHWSPFGQLAQDAGIKYPVQGIRDHDGNHETYALLGSQFVAYCTSSNPNGIAPLGPALVPLPSWQEEWDDPLFRSSLLSADRRLPGFFTKRCVGPQVGK